MPNGIVKRGKCKAKSSPCAEPGGGVSDFGVAYEFLPRRYSSRVFNLQEFGIPFVPVIGQTSYPRVEVSSSWHIHKDCIEIIYCKSGTCEYESCGKNYQFSPGRVIVWRPNEPHRQVSNPKGYSTFYLLFRKTKHADIQCLADELLQLPRLFNGSRSVRTQFCRILSMVDSGSGKLPASFRLRLRTRIFGLLLDIIDSITLSRQKSGGLLREIVDQMQRFPEKNYPLSRLVAEAGVSQSSYINSFKTETGFSPHTYLLNCRIKMAKKCLVNGMSVKATADRLGFSSPQHLSSIFQNIVGVTPKQWQTTECT